MTTAMTWEPRIDWACNDKHEAHCTLICPSLGLHGNLFQHGTPHSPSVKRLHEDQRETGEPHLNFLQADLSKFGSSGLGVSQYMQRAEKSARHVERTHSSWLVVTTGVVTGEVGSSLSLEVQAWRLADPWSGTLSGSFTDGKEVWPRWGLSLVNFLRSLFAYLFPRALKQTITLIPLHVDSGAG